MRGLECLAHFARRLDGFLPTQVRAVATQTLREARNRDAFLLRAQTVLGRSIEIISGREEARLIFAGVARLQPSTVPRLVIDIGGRSTEMIVGRGTRPRQAESFQVGSVSLSMKYFPEGRFSERAFREAQIAAGAELEEALAPFAPSHWKEALGSSGTVGAVSSVLAASNVSDGRITPAGLRWLMERCLEAGSADRLELPGLEERSPRRHRRRPLDPLHAGDAFRHRRAQAGARRPAPGRDLRSRRAPGGRAPRRRRRPARGVGARAAAAVPGRRRAGRARRPRRRDPAAPLRRRNEPRGDARAGVGGGAARSRDDDLAPRPPSAQRLPARPRRCARLLAEPAEADRRARPRSARRPAQDGGVVAEPRASRCTCSACAWR